MFFFAFFFCYTSSKSFPSIKYTKGGIYGWFNALALMKKPFDNKKMLGFLLNATDPDLSMIVHDIANNLDLHDLNLSQKISDSLKIKKTQENETEQSIKPNSKNILLSDSKCSDKTGNSRQFCKMFGDVNIEKIGITEPNFNIFLGNVFGYLPTNLFFVIIASMSIIYYIIQIILQYRYFKPREYSNPSIIENIFFYAGDALVFISAILFLFAFTGVDRFISTITSLDTIVPRITYSVASSLEALVEDGLPNGLNPIFQAAQKVLHTTQQYLNETIDSFIIPTSIFFSKMVSESEDDMGVFNIYNKKIHSTANEFYKAAEQFPSLDSMTRIFMSKDFTDKQEQFEEFYNSEMNLSKELSQLDTFFSYYYSIIEPIEDFFTNMSNKTLNGQNRTIGEMIEDLKEESLANSDFLTKLHKDTKKKNPLWIFLAIIFFAIGIFWMVVPAFVGLVFWMHNKTARCVANTIAICPLVATILMFVLSFLMTGIGFALVAVSGQFERRVDDFISNVIDVTIPTRQIDIRTINFTNQTDGNFIGELHLSPIIFPKEFDHFEVLMKHEEEDGIATATQIEKIIDMNKYSNEIGTFLGSMSSDFNLPDDLLDSLNVVKTLLSILGNFPASIDSLFNFYIPISKSTNYLRNEIQSKEPNAMSVLEPFLSQIDVFTREMNSQFEIGMEQLTHNIPDAINQLNTVVPRFIKDVLIDLENSTRHLLKEIYPMIDNIQSGMIVGPYALARNAIFYDLSNTCAFVSASGTLMIFGLVVVVTMVWYRRRGMMHVHGREIGFFEFILTCRKKKIYNDHSCDSMETDDSNLLYLHDSNFDINTSYCQGNDFEEDGKGCPFRNDDYDDPNNWIIDDDFDDKSLSSDEDDNNNNNNIFDPADDCSNWSVKPDSQGNFVPVNSYVCDRADDNNNFCVKQDSKGNYVPDNSYISPPEDNCDNWTIKPDSKGNYDLVNSYVCPPEDDCENFTIKPDTNGNFVPDDSYVCPPEDDNNNFIVRLNRDGTIYNNKFGEDYAIKDSINDVGEAFLDGFNANAKTSNVNYNNIDTINDNTDDVAVVSSINNA